MITAFEVAGSATMYCHEPVGWSKIWCTVSSPTSGAGWSSATKGERLIAGVDADEASLEGEPCLESLAAVLLRRLVASKVLGW